MRLFINNNSISGKTGMVTLLVFLFVGILCFLISAMRAPQYNMDIREALEHIIVIVVGAFIGVKLLYAIQNFSIPPKFNGLSFFGTFYFAPVFVAIYNKIKKTSWLRSMDFVSLYAALALVVFRFNCYTTGCCGAMPIYAHGRTVTPPIQLIEAFFDFLIFAFLWWRESGPVREGASFPLLLTMYGILRLVMENYRSVERATYGMSDGQWNSIIAIIVGGIWLYRIRNKNLIKRAIPKSRRR